MQVFVTGTDTDVGKTFVTAGLAAVMQSLGYKSGVYKPFQSGAEVKNGFLVAPDLAYVKQLDFYVETLCSYLMKAPTAPYIAAELEGIEIEMDTVKKEYETIKNNCEILLVEGAGGLMVPVTKEVLMIDVAKMFDIPLLIVARPDLGTINHTLMTIKCAQSEGIKILGVVISNYPQTTNDPVILRAKEMIEKYCNTKVIDIIKQGQTDLSKLAQKLS